MNELDTLLCAPLTDIADNGFSARIMLRIERRRFYRQTVLMVLAATALLSVLLLLPLWGLDAHATHRFFGLLDQSGGLVGIGLHWLWAAAGQPGIVIGAAVLLATLFWDRQAAAE